MASSLASLDWRQVNSAGDYHQFDNLSVTIGPTISSIAAVTPDPRTSPVATVDVTLSVAADLATFTYADLTLTRDGSPVTLNSNVTLSLVSGTTYQIDGLSAFTGAGGSYALTVNARNVSAAATGLDGMGSNSIAWSKIDLATVASTTPALTGGMLAAGTTSLQVTFNASLAFTNEGPPIAIGTLNYPAYSARQLLLAAPGTPSGVYWFDPDGSGPLTSFQAYADMTTDGGGWMLAVNSVMGSEAPSNEITAHLGSPNTSVGHTRDAAYLAQSQTAQIRHQIDAGNQGQGQFHGKYTGLYENMPAFGEFTLLAASTTGRLANEYGKLLNSTPYGSRWYSGSTPFSSIPATPANGAGGPAINNNPGQVINSYRVWVRETAAPPSVPATLPGDPPTGAADPDNYELRRADANGLLGEPSGNDDVIVPMNVSYESGTKTSTLTFAGLSEDVYRLTVKDTMINSAGYPLDGNADGAAGGDWRRDFVVGADSHAYLAHPQQFPLRHRIRRPRGGATRARAKRGV